VEGDNSVSTSCTTLLVIVPNTLCIRPAARVCIARVCCDTYSPYITCNIAGQRLTHLRALALRKRFAHPRAGPRSFAIITGKTETIARNACMRACVCYVLTLTRGCTGNYAVRPCMEIAYRGTQCTLRTPHCVFISS